MPRQREGRIYKRGRRYWADFRDVGGDLEPLKVRGEKWATTDYTLAEKLASNRLTELRDRQRGRVVHGLDRQVTLEAFASEHLTAKAKANKVTTGELEKIEQRLGRAVAFFGADRELGSIGVRDVERWTAELTKLTGRKKGQKLSGQTIRHHLNAVSNMYRRAQAEAVVPPGYNPVAAMMEKPTPAAEEARWLEVHEAALLLEAARAHKPARGDDIQCVLPLLATFLLTGGRKSEVLGLAVEDVSFDRRTVTFRPHPWRRLKTKTSRRVVPLWPQLEEILRTYIFGGDAPQVSGLLFPSARTGKMIVDIRKSLDAVAERGGWAVGDVTSKMLRHTYCSARLQTLDRGAPVSPWTVGKEMGHGGMALVNRVYGHLGDVRHRSEIVEYRAEQHRDILGERLAALRAWKPPRCKGVTAAGEPCQVSANLSQDGFCIWHDSARRDEAKRARPHARR